MRQQHQAAWSGPMARVAVNNEDHCQEMVQEVLPELDIVSLSDTLVSCPIQKIS
eukprot:CAMPEP_0176466370 /NCGR_PEP_ID=MMETSP0127-20121128/37851_1 /TAXON_ID=938130 /ORGANISM="Platyophrya macrostoma, Strain WH" /LENGTH=53 /DNA_ID=CAMNT_0017859523 /DNA_START=406 /DNA_END=567 /DNA_ORIENTATION=-